MIRKLALAFLTLVSLALPSSAHAARGMEFALQDDNVFVEQRYMLRDQALDRAAALGTKRIRVNVLWAYILTTDFTQTKAPKGGPVYDFSRIDALETAATKRNIKLQLTVSGPAPAWATGNEKAGGYKPDPRKFAQFVRAVATHFNGRVDRYSVWNEPNLDPWLAPLSTAPRQYRYLYRAAYAEIKKVDPKAQVLFGELAPNRSWRTIGPTRFLQRAAPKNAKLKADGLALHPYQLTSSPRLLSGGPEDAPISRLSRVTKLLDQLARQRGLSTTKNKGLDLYLTEYGYLTTGRRALSASVRANWLRASYDIAYRNRRVKQILQYQLVDPPVEEYWHSAILDRRGRRTGAYVGIARAAAAFRR